MDVTLRKALPRDSRELARLFFEVRRNAFTWRDPATFALDDFEFQSAAENITVAEDRAGAIVGFVSVWEPDSFVHHLFVATHAQGLGVGPKLLHSLHDWLPFPHRLKCSAPNSKAEAFYRKRGWTEIGRGDSSDGPYLSMELAAPAANRAHRIAIAACPSPLAAGGPDAIHFLSTMNSTPIDPLQKTGGMVYFARMLDKIRKHAGGDLRADFHDSLGKGMDGRCTDFLRVDYADLKERVLKGGTDEEILKWCFVTGRELNDGDIYTWNHFIGKLGWRDPSSEVLARRKRENKLAHRDDIVTMFEFFDVDEQRAPLIT